MKYDVYGQPHCSSDELCNLLYINPDLDLTKFQVEDPASYNNAIKQLFAELPALTQYIPRDYSSLDEFDSANQTVWYMPLEYKKLDIAEYILDCCKTDAELQRVGQELILYQERNLFDLLRFMKYLVDTMRKNNIVWGVGRGSSVASYVLFLLGVHKINSMYYDLDIAEFLK